MKKRIIIFFIPILILLLMTISPLLTLTQGTEVTLETIPVDPTDIFRGDYVILAYDISEVEEKDLKKDIKDYFAPDPDSYKSIKVYSILEKGNDGYHKLKSVSLEKPKSDIYLEGSLSRYKEYEEPIQSEEELNEDELTEYYEENFKYVYNIQYNIDKYFVPENSGEDFEKASEKGNILAVIKVFKGNAILKEIKIK